MFAYKISWKDEKIIDTTLGKSEQFSIDKNLLKHTLILILPNTNEKNTL